MTDREAFLAAINAAPRDNLKRMAYSDWLEEQGEIEEAERQRNWEASFVWLEEFAADLPQESYYDDDPADHPVTAESIIELCNSHAKNDGKTWNDSGYEWPDYHTFQGVDTPDECYRKAKDMWQHWSIVTGHKIPDGCKDTSVFSCSC